MNETGSKKGSKLDIEKTELDLKIAKLEAEVFAELDVGQKKLTAMKADLAEIIKKRDLLEKKLLGVWGKSTSN